MKKLIIILLFATNLAHSTNYYVNDNSTTDDVFGCGVGNNTTGNGSKTTPYATFNKLWNVRTGTFSHGDTIFIDAGTYTSYSGGDGFGLNCGYTIQSRVHIKGAGNSKTIFDNQSFVGSNSSYVGNGGVAPTYSTLSYFAQITSGGAGSTINDIQFKNYQYKTASTGQVFSLNSLNTSTSLVTKFNNVIISNCGPSGSGASGNSAAIYFYCFNQINKVEINGGGFFCNGSASIYGGCIDVLGGGASANPKLTISNVAFIGNQKNDSQFDGGVVINTSGTFATDSLYISNSLFDGNTLAFSSANCGSVIYITTTAGTPIVNISKSIFKNNTISSAPTGNGGVCNFAKGTITISGCSFENNTFSTGTVKGSLASNTASLTLSNSSFSDNMANTASDVHLNGAGTINIANTIFSSSGTNLNRTAGSFTITSCGTPTSSGAITNNGGNPTAFSVPSVPSYTGSCASSNVSLPVELIFFSGKAKNNEVFLYWGTSSETNSDYFLIERSTDLENFLQIGIYKAAGFSNQLINYFGIDENPSNGTNYYRLTQFDFDGKYYIYPPISIESGSTENSLKFNFSIYPNPTHDKTFYIQHEKFENPTNYQIYNQNGMRILSAELNNDFSTKVELPSNFKAGIYFIRIGIISKRFVVI